MASTSIEDIGKAMSALVPGCAATLCDGALAAVDFCRKPRRDVLRLLDSVDKILHRLGQFE